MLGGTNIANVLGAAPARDASTDELKGFIRAACGVAGLQLLLIDPDGKTPLDMRTKAARNAADKAAREQAQQAGRKNWAKARSRAGVHLATADSALVIRYLTAFRKQYGENAPVNFGVRVAHPLVIADCDTAQQRDAFYSFMGVDEAVPYTVSSPGALADDGVTWKHRHGGHFYFVNEGEPLPDRGTGTITMPGGWALIHRDRYVLIPPSVRPEGPYTLTGRDYPLPDELRDPVVAIPPRAERTGVSDDLSVSIGAWAANTSWSDILTPDGWSPEAGRGVDGACGCPVWTAPGEHGSSRSATAHNGDCGLDRYEETDNAPIHIWTDNPGPAIEAAVAKWGKTLSKLQVFAAINHECDVPAAIEAEGVLPDKSFDPTAGKTDTSAANLSASLKPAAQPEPQEQADEGDGQDTDVAADAFSTPGGGSTTPPPTDPPTEDDATGDEDPDGVHRIGDMTIGPFGYWRELPPPEYMIDGLLEQGGLTCIIGESGVGKSTVVIDWMCSIVSGMPWQGRTVKRQRVLYLPGEGLHGAVSRVRAWEQAHAISVENDLLMANEILLIAAEHADWASLTEYMVRMGVGLLVVDTFARANLGIEENSATDVGKSIERFRRVQQATSAGVMVVHHTTRGTQHGRGSTALVGALDSEVFVGRGDISRMAGPGRAIDMYVTKQKNAPQPEDPILLSLVPFCDAVVLGPADGVLGDPMDAVLAAPTILPEPRIELAIRVARCVERLPSQGATRGELREAVTMSPFIVTRPIPEKAWKIAMNEAVDVALRYNLIQTLSGTAAGSRYVRGPASFDQARRDAVNDGVSD